MGLRTSVFVCVTRCARAGLQCACGMQINFWTLQAVTDSAGPSSQAHARVTVKHFRSACFGWRWPLLRVLYDSQVEQLALECVVWCAAFVHSACQHRTASN